MLLGTDKMISRTGKYTEERHMILQRKDEILSGSPKKQIVRSQSNFKIDGMGDAQKNERLLQQINFI